ncbi:16S rRNA (cytosine(1402)-N(4))-methyltransferase RsmH [Roseiterribacter gracilis]|uniref:Ribosomal RNA small subunit methyltransferase H n=1 Tax=Roseiterribacter gracilis TaxID=2812848 RepID=A0A8S8XAI8_9PROT|nr:ribosomal RNA small subunit methyltransferase H [Rhodospirillales bacterium TMPK1]
MTSPHIPVLLREVIDALNVRNDATYVDGTFGAGGYTRAILDAANCKVIAIDRDPDAIKNGKQLVDSSNNRLELLHGQFGDMHRLLGDRRVDGVTLDLGVSSMQLDQAERGFSFRFDGPLDMRMAQDGPSAADLVNTMDEGELADLIYQFGEERLSRRVAKAIVARRPFERTLQLADAVRSAVPKKGDGIDPATRTFQALRIAVNDELGELDRALIAAEHVLAAGGRLAIVTFHSLEDRRVKNFLTARSGRTPSPSRHLPAAADSRRPTFNLVSSKAIAASDEETRANPRARSAKLRAAERTDAPAWNLAA